MSEMETEAQYPDIPDFDVPDLDKILEDTIHEVLENGDIRENLTDNEVAKTEDYSGLNSKVRNCLNLLFRSRSLHYLLMFQSTEVH